MSVRLPSQIWRTERDDGQKTRSQAAARETRRGAKLLNLATPSKVCLTIMKFRRAFKSFLRRPKFELQMSNTQEHAFKALLEIENTFDSEYYLRNNSDVAKEDLDPFLHYLEHGIREGRAPSGTPAEYCIGSARYDANWAVSSGQRNKLTQFLHWL